ncbi:hypothetical protein QBC33DRAFT_278590 [Phialemonium atrogriseum]|uniref:Uncharacterized protein n=1 Tax=Phialemonium atrogriseum TaxID=1093897 RepID=A0AAJ0FJJ5_9PEZI|nr:uncharacterized protein QBC33DRAFT_278590 [Phialemonium atrogriseum]KAK1770696.1 hypothetical protein QBC33DRAFT_278590 [Phialemonium atrogriseum]
MKYSNEPSCFNDYDCFSSSWIRVLTEVGWGLRRDLAGVAAGWAVVVPVSRRRCLAASAGKRREARKLMEGRISLCQFGRHQAVPRSPMGPWVATARLWEQLIYRRAIGRKINFLHSSFHETFLLGWFLSKSCFNPRASWPLSDRDCLPTAHRESCLSPVRCLPRRRGFGQSLFPRGGGSRGGRKGGSCWLPWRRCLSHGTRSSNGPTLARGNGMLVMGPMSKGTFPFGSAPDSIRPSQIPPGSWRRDCRIERLF